MAKFCNTCRWWEPAIRHTAEDFGLCRHPVASGKMIVEHNLTTEADSQVFTAERFGCVYHQQGEGNTLIKIESRDPHT